MYLHILLHVNLMLFTFTGLDLLRTPTHSCILLTIYVTTTKLYQIRQPRSDCHCSVTIIFFAFENIHKQFHHPRFSGGIRNVFDPKGTRKDSQAPHFVAESYSMQLHLESSWIDTKILIRLHVNILNSANKNRFF